MFCTQCGHQNAEGSRFCARCGTGLSRGAEGAASAVETTSTISLAALEGALENDGIAAPAEPAADAAPAEALPPGSALLVVKRGPNAGSRFLLDADVTTAGRHPESDIFLTTSPCRGATRSSSARAAASWCATSAA
ncbi:MAG: domain containing protein [Frankiales bacterium]|nr:domain containing protein [Frankiales bacterium]